MGARSATATSDVLVWVGQKLVAKKLTLREASATGQLKRFIEEHPMRGNMPTFNRLLKTMAQGEPSEKPSRQGPKMAEISQ